MPGETVREVRYVNASMGEREGVGIGGDKNQGKAR